MPGPRFDVDARLGRDLRHTPYLLDGLAGLADAGEVRLRLHTRRPAWRDRVVVTDGTVQRVGRPYPWSADLDVVDHEDGSRRRISVDLQDWREMWSHTSLEASEVIVKRMCTAPEADVIAREYGVRVLPAGITGPGDAGRWARERPLRLASVSGRVETVLNDPRRLRRRDRGSKAGRAPDRGRRRVESVPAPEGGYVFFQVAHHDWGTSAEARSLNEARASLIRCLRASLGDRFLGGMTFTGEPVAGFEDCESTLPTDRDTYLGLVRRAAVVVSSNGFGGSPPWKLAEYLEAGSCIVSEPSEVALPVALEHDRHVWFASSPDDVAAVCARLLSEPSHRARLSTGAATYHAEVVEPRAAARRFLTAGREVVPCPA